MPQFNYIDIRDYSGSPSVDNTGPLNSCFLAALGQGIKEIYIPGLGNWNFDSKPNDVPGGIRLVGEGQSSSIMVANFNGDFLRFTGVGGMSGGVKSMCVYKGAGFSGGSAISLTGDNTASPDYCEFENVDVTGSGTWNFPLLMDGTARTTIQGVRDIKLRNINLFCGTSGAARLQNIVGCGFTDFSAFPAGGTSGNVYIGSGSSTNFFTNANILGELNISHATLGVFRGMVNSLNSDSTGTRWFIDGLVNGSVANNLVNSYVNLR